MNTDNYNISTNEIYRRRRESLDAQFYATVVTRMSQAERNLTIDEQEKLLTDEAERLRFKRGRAAWLAQRGITAPKPTTRRIPALPHVKSDGSFTS